MLIVVVTMVVCIVVGKRKRCRRRDKYSVSDGATKKEKSPSSDGYTNALYSGECVGLPRNNLCDNYAGFCPNTVRSGKDNPNTTKISKQ